MTKTYHVTAPSTPGSRPVVQATTQSLLDARRIARADYGHRRDLTYQDVRIERQDGRLVAYAGPAR